MIVTAGVVTSVLTVPFSFMTERQLRLQEDAYATFRSDVRRLLQKYGDDRHGLAEELLKVQGAHRMPVAGCIAGRLSGVLASLLSAYVFLGVATLLIQSRGDADTWDFSLSEPLMSARINSWVLLGPNDALIDGTTTLELLLVPLPFAATCGMIRFYSAFSVHRRNFRRWAIVSASGYTIAIIFSPIGLLPYFSTSTALSVTLSLLVRYRRKKRIEFRYRNLARMRRGAPR
jgi:hypothetical protein